MQLAPSDLALSPTRWLAMIPMMLGVLVGALTISPITTALPAIRADISLSSAEALWIIDAYPLALAATLVIAARLGDRFGRRTIMAVGLVGFAGFNLLAGLTDAPLVLIAMRALLGLAEAMVIANVVATIGTQFHARERVLAYGMWTAAFGSGTAFGPVVGGLLAEGPGWRWIMLGCVPIALITLALALWLVPQSRTTVAPHWDALSVITSLLALGGIVYAMQHLAADTVSAAIAAVLGTIALVVFIRRQRVLADPLIDVRLFAIRDFTVAILRILVTAGAGAATVYLVSLHLQDTRGASAVDAGMALLPQAVMFAVGGVLAPLVLRWLSNTTTSMVAMAVMGAGLAWTALDPELLAIPLTLVGLGGGIVATLAATALFDATTAEQAGQVGAVQEVGFALGNGLGVAVLGTIAISFTPGTAIALWAAAALSVLAAFGPRIRIARR